MKMFIVILFTLSAVTLAVAQKPLPTPETTADQPYYKLFKPLPDEQKFVSIDGNFSIDLHKELVKYMPLPGNPSNHTYFWDYRYVAFMVFYMEPKGPEMTNDKFYQEFFEDQKKSETDRGSKFVSQTNIKVPVLTAWK
jgi:hypothetical protein